MQISDWGRIRLLACSRTAIDTAHKEYGAKTETPDSPDLVRGCGWKIRWLSFFITGVA